MTNKITGRKEDRKEDRRDDNETEDTPVVRIQLPAERAEFFFLRAKRLYELGGRYSVITERVVTTTLKVLIMLRQVSDLHPLRSSYHVFDLGFDYQ